MQLNQVCFPVYRLTQKQPEADGDVLYYKNTYISEDTNEMNTVVSLIDDRSIQEDSLSRRRLKLRALGVPLYPIRKAIFFLGDFIKMAKSGYYFIDSRGSVFTYKKQIRCPLRFRKITKVIPSKTTGSILEVEGVPNRLKTLFIIKDTMKYAGILYISGDPILYGVYDKKYRDTWRMV